MKRIRYSKYVPDPAGEMSMEDLLSALSDYLLQSGFQSDMWYEMPEGERSLDDLKRAIEQALMEGDPFDEEMRERMLEMAMNGQLDELIEKLIERMQQEDYISIDQPPDPSHPSGAGGQLGENAQQAKFEITDKSLDFLGFKSLRNLLGSLGKSSFGRHDTPEEVPLSQLARVKVGPYYTNTREGLRLAQRILQRQRKDMKQIVMITDGKPSALTLEDGRIYKNAFGLDPLVVSQTLEEVSKCKRAGVMINTFMLASDYGLVQFVQKVTEMCRGKAYFTTPYTLGQYLLMDYMSRKTKTIH